MPYSLAHAAGQLPALLLDVLDPLNRLHAREVAGGDLGDPLHACRVAPAPVHDGGLEGAAHHGAQAALRWALGGVAQLAAAAHPPAHGCHGGECATRQFMSSKTECEQQDST